MTDPAASWDREAARFDDEPDHGLLDSDIRHAWRSLLLAHLPASPAKVLDIGCGTGTLAALLAAAGYEVCGFDRSFEMLARARAKAIAADVSVGLAAADAARPPFASESFDAVLCRHVLWAMGDIDDTLEGWSSLARPTGVLVLIEGKWSTGVGLASGELIAALERLRRWTHVEHLADERLWGRPVEDDRYLVVSGVAPARSLFP